LDNVKCETDAIKKDII